MADKKDNIRFDPTAFVDDGNNKNQLVLVDNGVPEPTKKRGGRKKNEIATNAPPPVATSSMSYLQQNIPYSQAFQSTAEQLDETIQQFNAIGAEIMNDVAVVRSSKTMRNKYNVITGMTENAISVLNGKLSAIKEKNSTAMNIAKLELQRSKDMKLQANDQSDESRIADLYNAFVNTPVGVNPVQLGPSMQDMTMVGGYSSQRMDLGYNDQSQWQSNLDPSQRRMLLDAQGNIETIVVYDDTTGNRYFAVVDKQTRQPVPNVETPSNDNIYDLDINLKGNYAKDSNRNVMYPLVVISGGNSSINQY